MCRPIGLALFEEGVPSFHSLVGHVGESGGFSGEDLLTHKTIVDEVHGEFGHSLAGGGLPVDDAAPVEGCVLELGMGDDEVDHAHRVCLIRRVISTEEEDLACSFLADHASEVRRTISAIEAGDVGVGLFKDGVLGARDRQVTDHVKAVSAANRPPWDDRDDNFWHETDQALDLEDVQARCAGRVDAFCCFAIRVLIPGSTPDSLIASGTKRPPSILWRRTVAGDKDTAHIAGHPGMIEATVELVDCARSERVTDLGAVKGHTHRSVLAGTVIRDVDEVLETRNRVPF